MYHKSSEKITQYSQELRKNMTKEEKHLWFDFLKNLPFNVKRQYTIGNYIADFYIPKYKIVIELDGGEHYENGQREYDEFRNKYMEERGMTVLRYINPDIKNKFQGVCQDILNHIESKGETP